MQIHTKILLTISIGLNIVLIGLVIGGFTSNNVYAPATDGITTDDFAHSPAGNEPDQSAYQYKDLVTVEAPLPDQKISSPLTISGKARGTWFFEATFPVVLTDWDGLIIAEGYAEAKDSWMTEDYVPFEATLEFDKPSYGERGSLILQKANASGLPEHDDAVEFMIRF